MIEAVQDVSLDQVMARRFELVEQIGIIAGRQKAELAPLNEELGLCETFVKDHMNKGGLQQVKTAAGMTFFTTKDSVTVKDMDQVIHHMIAAAPPMPDIAAEMWPRVVDHIYAHGMWGILNKAVNKTAVKELIDAKASPPGVEYSSYKDLSWRREKQ